MPGNQYDDSTELNCIDCGVVDITSLPLHRNLTVLNLHYNSIKEIQGLQGFTLLRHLDLSSNMISKMEGLSELTSLRTLNLASNKIKKVEGIHTLRNMVKINLSYNAIRDLSGFSQMRGPTYKLTVVELQGNQVRLVSSVVKNLAGVVTLRQLVLQSEKQRNPVCDARDYRSTLLHGLLQLEVLDGKGRDGRSVHVDVLADIPGLDEYLEFISSTSASESPQPDRVVPTPRIDAAYSAFRQRPPTSGLPQSFTDDAETKETTKVYEERIERLEKQISDIISAKDQPAKRSRKTPKEESSSTTYPSKETSGTASTSTTPRRDAGPVGTSKPSGPAKVPLRSKTPPREGVTGKGPISGVDQPNMDLNATYPTRDTATKGGSEMTFGQILKELDDERERRWKAEEACHRLMDHVKRLEEKNRQDVNVQGAALNATSKLRDAFANERESRLNSEEKIKALSDENEYLKHKLEESHANEDRLRTTLQSLEESGAHVEAERAKEATQANKRVHEAQMSASAAHRELEMVQTQMETCQGQLRQLQDLMTSREKEYQTELNKRYTLDSRELQQVIEKQVKAAEMQGEQHIRNLQEKVTEWKEKFAALEDEFRMALRIEADRFQEMQNAYERAAEDASSGRKSLVDVSRKEEDGREMVAELTGLVKEQKMKLSEMTKTKQEFMREYKERVGTLEAHLEEARRRMLQLEMTKQENKKLLGQIQAQESVIEGLRAERRLWGEELAQQGVSLAQNRGRLEVKIETLQSEILTLQKQLEGETDTVKIKTKLIEDQTETIRKLKESGHEKDKEVRHMQETSTKTIRELEGQLKDERELTKDLQDKIDKVTRRKEELKDQVLDLQERLEKSQKSHDILTRKWREQSESISRMEAQVMEMKSQWDEEKALLEDEKEQADRKVKEISDQSKRLDNELREKLRSAETARAAAVIEARSAAEGEARVARQRVAEVEAEMRELLAETEKAKRATEAKISRLTSAFKELHSDLNPGS